MILDVEAGDAVEIPVNADLTLRIKSPFTESELATATLTVECTDPNDVLSEVPASADGTDVLLAITPGMFTPGLWELNPVAVVAGKVRTTALAIPMNVLERGVSRYPSKRPRYSVQ
jgi:hypothetical protein